MRYVRMVVPALAIAAAFVPWGAKAAVDLCSEPLQPVCVGMDSTYQSKDTTEACRSELKQYDADAAGYAKCLQGVIKDDNKEAAKADKEFKKRLHEAETGG